MVKDSERKIDWFYTSTCMCTFVHNVKSLTTCIFNFSITCIRVILEVIQLGFNAFTAKVFSPDIKRNQISTEITKYEFVLKAWFLQLSSHLPVQLKKKCQNDKPKPGKFLLEVSGVPNSAFSQWQDLSNDVILLPLASPNLANIPFQTDVNQHAFLSRNIWK